MRIFVGYEDRQDVAYQVLRKSILEKSSVSVSVHPLRQADLRTMGWERSFDPWASTEFTYTRFLVPHLCGFKGVALYVDCDFLCLADIAELCRLDMEPYALRVVKHDYAPASLFKMDGKFQTRYPRKNWSSLMLMNCERLTSWTLERVREAPASWLHRFESIPDSEIGEIDISWNRLDENPPDTKMIHFTSGGPWLNECKNHPLASLWFHHKERLLDK